MRSLPGTLNRDILRLAVPALGALVAEPLFLIVDSALVGHLGVTPLAGLGIASALLQTIVGLMVFLAYSTTPAVARRFGAGDPSRAVSVGIDGMWLALGIGGVLALVGYLATPFLVGLFGATPLVAEQAEIYLGISMWGLPAMLIVFAATGLLRGMQDTVTPLWIAGIGFAANALLNWLFIYGVGWGIAGSAVGTVLAQWGMVAAYVLVVGRLARRHAASVRPHREGCAARPAPAAGCSCARCRFVSPSSRRSPSRRRSARASWPGGRSRSPSSPPPPSHWTRWRSPRRRSSARASEPKTALWCVASSGAPWRGAPGSA
nr:hypothetical protein GCM10025699_11100 [Microbacterium flavescens]